MQINRLKTLWIVAASLFMAACATTAPPEQFVLRPVASEDGSKRFTYSARAGRGAGANEAGRQGGNQAGRQGGEQNGNSGARGGRQAVGFDQLREGLEDYMAVTNYCTQGYFVYDETYNGNEYLLHGECQESKNNE